MATDLLLTPDYSIAIVDGDWAIDPVPEDHDARLALIHAPGTLRTDALAGAELHRYVGSKRVDTGRIIAELEADGLTKVRILNPDPAALDISYERRPQ